MSKIKCFKCGFENDEENDYCTECGSNLKKGFFSKLKNLFSSKNNKKIFDEYKQKRVRIKNFNEKYSPNSNTDQYISSTEDILSKNKDIFEKLEDFKQLKLNLKDYESLDAFDYNYNNLDDIVEKLNKEFLKNYYSENKNKIKDFLNLNDFIDDYKSILNENKFLYKNFSYCENPPEDVKNFINRYDNFKEISEEINERYINENLHLDKIKKFINDYTKNIDYEHQIDKDIVLLNYSSEYHLAKKIPNPENEIIEFISCYENFDEISANINDEITRRNEIQNGFKNNLQKIESFINTYENPSENLFITNYYKILDEFKNQYIISSQLMEFNENKIAKKFIELYDNFEDISKSINKNYVDRLIIQFNEVKNEIIDFLNKFRNNITYDKFIDENEKQDILNQYKYHEDISSKLIKVDDSHNNLILDFLQTYNNFDEIIEKINEEYNNRIELKEYFKKQKSELLDFINEYEKNVSSDLYIEDPKLILKNQKDNYDLVLKYKSYFNENLDITDLFINIYDNFEDISKSINENYVDRLIIQFNEVKNEIIDFLNKFKNNITYDKFIDENEKQDILNQYKCPEEISSKLIKVNDSQNNLLSDFLQTYNNFDDVVEKINEEYNHRIELKEYFEKQKPELISFIDKYEKDVSSDLYIEDPNLILNNQKENHDLVLKYKSYFDDNQETIDSFIHIYDNFDSISEKINEEYCKNKYETYSKNNKLIQHLLTKFSNLTIDEYILHKKDFIKNYFDIYSQSIEILEYNNYLKLSKDKINFINNFINLYDYFDVNFIKEYKNKYSEIELEALDFVETYRFDTVCAYYIQDYESLLKDYKEIYDLLKDIEKLKEIDFDVDDFIQVYENFDIIVEKTNKCYIKRILSEFNLIKNEIISFIQYFDNLRGYINDDNIIQNNKDNYDKLKEMDVIPNIKSYLDGQYELINNFNYYYENYDEIILKHNDEFVNNYYDNYKTQIKLYVDVLEKNSPYYLSNSRLNQLSKDFKSVLGVVKNLRDYQKDYAYIKDSKLIDKFPNKFNLSENEVKIINESYIDNELKNNKNFFDTILKHPLDDNQRRAVVIDEDNTQIIAGAGTGKTYALQAKIKYLVEKKGVSPENILALSFSNLSVNDLKDQIDKIGVDIDISTFHSLGLSILRDNGLNAKVLDYGLKTAIKNYFSTYLLKNPEKIDEILKYFAYYIYTPLNKEEIENIGEVYDYENGYNLETFYSEFKKLKDPTLDRKTFQGEYVKSLEERMVANFLFLNGIKYVYETDYEPLINYHQAKDYLFDFFNDDEIPRDIIMEFVNRMLEELEIDEEIYWPNGDKVTSYHPDFYLKDYGIYYEHFGVNRNCKAPWYPNSKRERTYIQEMRNKRKLHKKYGTKLIETYSYYHSENRLLKRLEEKLKNENIEFKPIDAKSFLITLLSNENKMNEYYEFIKLVETFLSLFKGNGYKKAKFKEFRKINKNIFKDFVFEKHELFLSIAENIYDYYNEFLKENNAIDFNDMINDACEMIQEKGYSKDYSYIIVDEYQDTSHTRYNLLKHIKDYYNANLIVVGDDWQSIYRFTGCDVDLFTNFADYFEDTKTEICEITNTYRNSQSLIDISGNFIMKNPHQYKKQLVSKAPNQIINGSIILCQYLNKKDQPFLFENIINEIYNHSKNKNNVKILVLGRNNADYKAILHENLFTTTGTTDNNTLKIIYQKNPKIKIKFLTVHGSKGLEENNVIVLNLEDKKAGFPNKMEDDSVLFFVKNEKDEGIEFAEERRLFYVALTRTRNYSFLFSPVINKSKFVEELIEDNELVEFKFEKMYEEYGEEDNQIRIIYATEGVCPECGTGKMVLKFNPQTGKSFFNCSNWSRCDWFGGRFFGEIEELENVTLCPECGGILLKILNRYGEYFYGCINYYPDKICTFSCNVEDVENPKYCPKCGELLISSKSSFYHCTSYDCSFSCLVNKYEDIIKKHNEKDEKEIEDMINKAQQLEKSNHHESAIKIYEKIENNIEAYKRLCICYRKLNLYSDELNLMYKSVHNKSFDDKEKEFFKNRIKEFNFETKKSKDKIKLIKSNKKCPECGKPIILKIVEKRNNIKYITCSNSDCYWFGGVFEGDINDFERYML